MNLARCWCLGILCNVFQTSSAFSSGWSPIVVSTFTELWLVIYGEDSNLFFQKQLPCSSTFSPCCSDLSLMLGNSNKILPQYFVLSCRQPDFFIHFISLCVQKDRISNRFFTTLSLQTYSHCFFCIRDFIGVFFHVFYFSCVFSVVMACSKALQLSRWHGRNLRLAYKMIH